MEVIFRPLTEWPSDLEPTPADEREGKRWDRHYPDILRDLEEELGALEADNIVIQAQITREDLRIDGMPRADALFRGPSVIVTFETPDGAWHTYPSDSFRDYRQNLKAVAMTLRGLRLVQGYGCAKRGQQYRGWQALPPGTGPGDKPTFAGPREAAKYIADYGDRPVEHVLEIPDVLSAAFRLASKRLHPDKNGGNGEAFQLLEAARTFVEDHQARTAATSR